jgi:hypothetical protein
MAMPEQEAKPQKLTMSNTKKEMLAAYKELLQRLEEKREAEMKPEQKIREKEEHKAVAVADSLSMEGIATEIGNLKAEIGKMLVQLSDKLEEAIGNYLQTKKAVEVRGKELAEIYEIEKAASSLTALLEAQKEKREQFETEMAEKKEELEDEIESTREEWEQEQATHEAEVKEREATEKKARDRDAEEYKYKLERERQRAREEFEYEKARLEREIQAKKEEMEKDLCAREKALSEREAELAQLRQRVEAFPKELEAAVSKAAEQTTERLTQEAQTREELIKKDAEAEQKVLNSRITALQQTLREQGEQIARLSAQIEKSYGQVQDIAVKAIEGSASVKALAAIQAQTVEQRRPQAQGEA